MEKHTCTDSECDQAVKVCVKCEEAKPRSDYHRNPGAADGHRNDCKMCRAAYKRGWYEQNRDAQMELNRARYAANLEENRAKSRAYGMANREKVTARVKAWRAANPERHMETVWAWREANPDKYWGYMKKYHADRYANDPEYREKLNSRRGYLSRLHEGAVQEHYTRRSIFDRDGWVCQLCEEEIDPALQWPDPRAASIDHIVPLSLGGDDTPGNTQAAHMGCNSRKGNRIVA